MSRISMELIAKIGESTLIKIYLPEIIRSIHFLKWNKCYVYQLGRLINCKSSSIGWSFIGTTKLNWLSAW